MNLYNVAVAVAWRHIVMAFIGCNRQLVLAWQHRHMTTPEHFFRGSPTGLALYKAVASVISSIGTAKVTVSKSQIAFRGRKGFAYVWRPGQYLNTSVPAVLSLALPHELHSPRFKEVVQTAPKNWMHHIELQDPDQIDSEVRAWLAAAYENAQ